MRLSEAGYPGNLLLPVSALFGEKPNTQLSLPQEKTPVPRSPLCAAATSFCQCKPTSEPSLDATYEGLLVPDDNSLQTAPTQGPSVSPFSTAALAC